MPEIGVRDLKTHASEIIRQVRDRQARYIITYRGQPVGLLLPLKEPRLQVADPWDELVQLGQAIGQSWQTGQTSGEILVVMRR
jgi:prevent-host-death family protein